MSGSETEGSFHRNGRAKVYFGAGANPSPADAGQAEPSRLRKALYGRRPLIFGNFCAHRNKGGPSIKGGICYEHSQTFLSLVAILSVVPP